MVTGNRWFVALLSVVSAFAASVTSPPSGALSVGSGRTYTTVQAAVNALPKDSTSQVIFIYPGTYKETVIINRAGPTKIQGYTTDDTSYSSNQVLITNNIPASQAGSNAASGTVQIYSANTNVYNVNIENSYGKPVDQSQAIALTAGASQLGFYGVGLYGYQDTLLTNSGTQYFSKCFIQGAVDFIFGMNAAAYFKSTTINVIRTAGYITAQGRQDSSRYGYIFNGCTITRSSDTTAKSVWLGRPWRNYSFVIYMNTNLNDVIQPAGWTQWSSSTPNTDHVFYAEYANTGSSAATSSRASFSTQLTSSTASTYTAAWLLGSTSWVDSRFL